ncbi:hypothetical protein ACKWTF_010500 [Chironomus riparius]
MDVNDVNELTVTREFEWNVERINFYLVSEVFEIFMENNSTKWQVILYREALKVFALLKKVESTTNDFVVHLSINSTNQKDKAVNLRFDANYFYETWSFIHTIDCYLSITEAYNKVNLPKDTFTLQIKITLTPKTPESAEKCGSNCMIKNYGSFLDSEKLSDFKFVCSDNVEISAHRFVLLANAPIMYKMLPKSDPQNRKKVDEDGETIMQVLRFLYTGKLDNILNMELKLIKCADKYELEKLKAFVAQLMIKNITIDNVLDYFELADEYDEDELLEKCIFFIHKNYQTLQQHDDWEEFDSKMKALMKISYLRNGYKNPVYVLKSWMAYLPMKLPSQYKPFQ